MTASSYGIDHTTIEKYTGVAYTDMMNAGAQMTPADWAAFCTEYVEVIAQVVHRFCNVKTFDPAQPEAAIVEYHSGRGATDDSVYPTMYNPSDYQYYLREIFYAASGITIEEDIAGKTALPNWTARVQRTVSTIGDFEVVTTKELTQVAFYNNVPGIGQNNLRFTYTTGYPSSSKEYADIRFQILRVFKNLILAKKNVQSVFTIIANGTRDYQGLTNQYNEGQILSHMEESLLKRYRRVVIPGGPFTD